jgi:monomeric isocitrate dehydrogenase
MDKKTDISIDQIFQEGTLIDNALKQAVQEALVRHKQSGHPIVVWRDGKIVWIQPEEISLSKA